MKCFNCNKKANLIRLYGFLIFFVFIGALGLTINHYNLMSGRWGDCLTVVGLLLSGMIAGKYFFDYVCFECIMEKEIKK